MSIEQEIRNEIDNIKQLKIDVGDINNHLSILEGLCRERNQKAVENAYQRGLDDGKAQDSHGCEGCEWDGTPFDVCSKCRNSYGNLYKRKESDDEIKVGDEVRHERGWTAVVTWIFDNRMTLMGKKGAIAD